MGLELIVKTDLDHMPPIEFNYDGLKAALNASLERYRGLVIEEKDLADAKKDRASLNKLSDALSDEKKRVKKQCLAQYEDFEVKVKELIGMVNAPADEIDKKIKSFENRQKEAKKTAIDRFFKDNVKDLYDYLTFDKIYDPKWENVSAKMIDISDEIMQTFERIRGDITAIKSMSLKHEAAALAKYKDTLSLGDAIKENSRLLAIEEAEAAKKAAEGKDPPLEYIASGKWKESVTIKGERLETVSADPAQQVIQQDFRVWATAEQLKSLSAFLKSNGIKYGRVPEQKEAV